MSIELPSHDAHRNYSVRSVSQARQRSMDRGASTATANGSTASTNIAVRGEAHAEHHAGAGLMIDVGHNRDPGTLEQYHTPQLKHRIYAAHVNQESSFHDQDGYPVIPPLSRLTTACYSVGHFMNDATASCWFSYLLLYLQQVQGLSGMSVTRWQPRSQESCLTSQRAFLCSVSGAERHGTFSGSSLSCVAFCSSLGTVCLA
jgi:hypothetical protein